jgi:hypothetical protein
VFFGLWRVIVAAPHDRPEQYGAFGEYVLDIGEYVHGLGRGVAHIRKPTEGTLGSREPSVTCRH